MHGINISISLHYKYFPKRSTEKTNEKIKKSAFSKKIIYIYYKEYQICNHEVTL